MSKIFLKVTIKYRDDKIKMYRCTDSPVVGPDWITLFPIKDPLTRHMIPKEGVAEIKWEYKTK